MKRWLLALLCPTLLMSGFSSCAAPSKPLDGATLVTFGDSITALSTWPKDTAALLNMKLVNAGIGGHTSAHGLQRFDRDVATALPDFVIISFGSNDFYRPDGNKPRVTVEEYQTNLKALIAKTKDLGAMPILMTPPFISPAAFGDASGYPGGDINVALDEYVDAMRTIAEDQHVGLIDIHALCDDGQSVETFLCSDGVHLSSMGNQLYRQTIVDYMTAHFKRDLSVPKVAVPTAPPLQSGTWTKSLISYEPDAWREVFPNTVRTVSDNEAITFRTIENGFPEIHYSPAITEAVTVPVANATLHIDVDLVAATNISLFFNGITPTLTYTDEHLSLTDALLKADPTLNASGSDLCGGQQVRCSIPLKDVIPLSFIANDGTVVVSGVKVFVVGAAGASVTIRDFSVTTHP